MKRQSDLRVIIVSATTPRRATQTAHEIGKRFRAEGGAYYRMGEPYEAKSLRWAVWLELRGPQSVVAWFDPTPRV